MELPSGVVQGGWLTDGTPLYVARIWRNDVVSSSLGYYNPVNGQAFTSQGAGVVDSREMDVLVVVWPRRLLWYITIDLPEIVHSIGNLIHIWVYSWFHAIMIDDVTELIVLVAKYNIISDNGVVTSSNKPFLEPMFTQISVAIWRN